MKKIMFLAVSGALALMLSGCGESVAYSLKEVCDNPNKKYTRLEADVIYEERKVGMLHQVDRRIYDINGDKSIFSIYSSHQIGYGMGGKKPGEKVKVVAQNPRCSIDTVISPGTKTVTMNTLSTE